jgi:hypothetical protein
MLYSRKGVSGGFSLKKASASMMHRFWNAFGCSYNAVSGVSPKREPLSDSGESKAW